MAIGSGSLDDAAREPVAVADLQRLAVLCGAQFLGVLKNEEMLDDIRRTMNDAEKAIFGIDKLNVPRSDIPAVTHVDHSAWIQTVHRETNPRYHALINRAGQYQFQYVWRAHRLYA